METQGNIPLLKNETVIGNFNEKAFQLSLIDGEDDPLEIQLFDSLG
jgi:hypothetical protein